MKNRNRTVHHHASRGFTLVELMIALAINLLMLAALVQVMGSSTKSYRTHEGVSDIQESARYAMEIVGRQVRLGGYHSNNLIRNLTDDLSLWPLNIAPNLAVDGSDNNGVNNSDILNVRYYIPEDCTTANCVTTPVLINGTVPAGDWVQVRFFLDTDRNLRCVVFNSAGANISDPVVTVPATGEALIEGVTDMQILYGIRLGSDMRYEAASTITADEWPNVVSVRINFTLDSTQTVDPNDPALAASNGRLQRNFTSTFTLRNRLSGA